MEESLKNRSKRMDERIAAFRRRNHSLRLSASRIAAMTGFHPYANLPELLMNLVYQGAVGQELLQHDSTLLGISLKSQEEILLELASKASRSTRQALQSALDVKTGKRRLETVSSAENVKKKVVEKAKESANLNPDELRILQEGVRSSVDTGFGTFHEDEAMNLYEKQCGWEVRHRNSQIMAWSFGRSEDLSPDATDTRPTLVPISPATTAWSLTEPKDKIHSIGNSEHALADRVGEAVDDDVAGDEPVTSQSIEKVEITTEVSDDEEMEGCAESQVNLTVDLDASFERSDEVGQAKSEAVMKPRSVSDENMDADSIDDGRSVRNARNHRPDEIRPFFTMFGSVDGIRDELWCPPPMSANHLSPSCPLDEEWCLREIIVECKHRMKTSVRPPPLYDQIQTTAYCLMYNVSEADIVQVVRKERPRARRRKLKATGLDPSGKVDADRPTEREMITTYFPPMKESSVDPVLGTMNSHPTKDETPTVEADRTAENECDWKTVEETQVGDMYASKDKALKQSPPDDSVAKKVGSTSSVPNFKDISDVADTSSGQPEICDDEAITPAANVEINIKRVSLDDNIMQHRRYWKETVLPRLRTFVEAVYRVRADDDKRYRLLSAMSDPSTNLGAWNVLHDECPWLKDCDTSFYRDLS